MNDRKYIGETRLLNYSHPLLAELVEARKWESMDLYAKIGGVYEFVRDEIVFGFNESDMTPASRVLEDGYGQCNTKATLFMALLRRVGTPCRIHGFGIDKRVQKGLVPSVAYALAPRILLHTWVEVNYEGRWLNLEGCILDDSYLKELKKTRSHDAGPVCGYGVAVEDIRDAPVQWQGASAYIQKAAIVEDYGAFDSPDELYGARGANLRGSRLKGLLYKHIVRKAMNARVAGIRGGGRN